MNSSSNEVKKLEPEIVIEYEPEPDDYNYLPPDTVVDEEELKQLSYTGQGTNNKKVVMVIVCIVVAAFIGAIIGYIYGIANESSNDVKRKSTIASTIKRSVDKKVDEFNKFAVEFDKLAGAGYDETLFDKVMKMQSDFMLDMSSEVSSEVILLNGGEKNPVKNLREYSANTMLLIQLLSIHRNETKIDREEIRLLLDKKEASEVTYAMRVNSDGIYYLGTTAPREQFANGILSIYSLTNKVSDDSELEGMYSNYKTVNQWKEWQRRLRDYVPEKGDKAGTESLDLPNRIMYEAVDRRGSEVQLFADELVLIDRKLLFGNAATALDRYNQRTDQIKRLIDSTRKISGDLGSDLSVFIKEEPKEPATSVAANAAGKNNAEG